MKAKILPKKDHNNRIALQDVIPLKTPYSIFIEPTDKCNFKCKFCPTGNHHLFKDNISYGNMDFDLFKKIINDISEFQDEIKLLNLYKAGEPLLNQNLPDMINYAKKSKKFQIISTTTNAYLLNEDLSLKIIDSGIDRINISIEGINEEQYYNVSNVRINFDKLVKNIEFLYKNRKQCHVHIKIIDNNMTENEKNEFYKIFGNICDSIFIEKIGNIWTNVKIEDENIMVSNLSIYSKETQYFEICSQIFYSIVINSNGIVTPCCADWEKQLVIGDCRKEKIKDIWNGIKLRNIQKIHLSKQRKEYTPCSTCDFPTHCVIDNIDNYADELLNKIILAEQSRAEQ